MFDRHHKNGMRVNTSFNNFRVNVKKLQNIQRNMEALLAKDTALKETAQRAFVAYMKSVFLMKDKEIFDISKLDKEAFAK